jgi:hypothetical protein
MQHIYGEDGTHKILIGNTDEKRQLGNLNLNVRIK